MSLSGPLFKWFGSKWQAATKYPTPKYGDIYEPFAGSAGYSLRHSHCSVTIFDTNPLLAKLWNWLINEATEENIHAIPINVEEGSDIRTLDLSEGQKLLLKHWQRTNNYGDCWTISPWGNKPGQWTKSTRERVAKDVYSVKHWKFEMIDYSKRGTYFIDPPYQYNYAYGAKNFDYETLTKQVESLNRPKFFESQVIACEAVCPKTGRVPNYLPFKTLGEFITSRRKEGENNYSKELVYTNF